MSCSAHWEGINEESIRHSVYLGENTVGGSMSALLRPAETPEQQAEIKKGRILVMLPLRREL